MERDEDAEMDDTQNEKRIENLVISSEGGSDVLNCIYIRPCAFAFLPVPPGDPLLVHIREMFVQCRGGDYLVLAGKARQGEAKQKQMQKQGTAKQNRAE